MGDSKNSEKESTYSYSSYHTNLEDENKLLKDTVNKLKTDLDRLRLPPLMVCEVCDLIDDGAIVKVPNGNKFFVSFSKDVKIIPGDTVLAVIEESDIIGHPCFVKLNKENYERDGEQRYAWKVFDAFSWSDGEILSADEVTADDLPF